MTGQTVQLRLVQVHDDGALEVFGMGRDQQAMIPADGRVTIDGLVITQGEKCDTVKRFAGSLRPWVRVKYSEDGAVIGVAFRSTPFYD